MLPITNQAQLLTLGGSFNDLRNIMLILSFIIYHSLFSPFLNVVKCLQTIAEGGCWWCWRNRSPLVSKVAPVAQYKRLNVDIL